MGEVDAAELLAQKGLCSRSNLSEGDNVRASDTEGGHLFPRLRHSSCGVPEDETHRFAF